MRWLGSAMTMCAATAIAALPGCGAGGGDDGGATGSSTSAAETEETATTSPGESMSGTSSEGLSGAGSGEGEEPAWKCSQSLDFLGSGALPWARAGAATASLTTWRVWGEDLDAAIRPQSEYTAQFEHWGPCGALGGDHAAVVVPLGPAVGGEPQSQLRVLVAGGARSYDLAAEGPDSAAPKVEVECLSFDGAVYRGAEAKSGTIEVMALPGAADEPLRVVLAAGGERCEVAGEIEVFLPPEAFAP